jgi:hypothetical protein
VGRVVKVEMIFYGNVGWESGGPGRVAGNGSTDSMLRLWLERGGDMTKHCRKMKRRQQARFGFMGTST